MIATSRTTTPRDLELQLQLMAALLTDPGYRPEGVERFRKNIDNFFNTLDSTPSRALSTASGADNGHAKVTACVDRFNQISPGFFKAAEKGLPKDS